MDMWSCCNNTPLNATISPKHLVHLKHNSSSILLSLIDNFHFPTYLWMIACTRCELLLIKWNKSFQKEIINMFSLSLTTFLGKPCNMKISLKNNYATWGDLNLDVIGKKCAYFVSVSTTTNIKYLPCALGNPVMNFMEMFSHLCLGMGNGCSNPARKICSPFFFGKLCILWCAWVYPLSFPSNRTSHVFFCMSYNTLDD